MTVLCVVLHGLSSQCIAFWLGQQACNKAALVAMHTIVRFQVLLTLPAQA